MSEPIKILVVEDEGVVAKDLQTRLRKLGYEVPLTVQSGEEAVVAARDHRPQLILMDVRLKGKMDGVEASAEIMRLYRTPVIFLTAYADDGTLGRAKLTEPYGFILKPFNERELHTAIQVALHKHQGKAALRKSERWLAGTLRSIGDAIIAVDNEMKVLFLNGVAAKLVKWSVEDAACQSITDVYRIIDAETGAALDSAAAFAAAGRGPQTLPGAAQISAREGVLVARDGSRVPVEENAAPILDDDGNVAGGVLVFRDISRRKQAEAAHRANEEQLRTLANSISHLAWMADADGNVSWYNERWYEYTGTTEAEMLGWGWQTVHDPSVLPDVLRRWKESLSSGALFDMELPLRSAAGQYRWFLTRVTPVKDASGNLVRWFGTNTDIDEAREIREQLQRANADLAQYAYSASHDLREPLRNVAIYSQLLEKKYAPVLDRQGNEFLSYITEGALRMETLVTGLLSYAESGKASEVPLELVDAGAILKDVMFGLSAVIEETGAKFTIGDLPSFNSRAVHVRQLFQNLIENAIKYRSESAPRIEVSAQGVGSEWVFSVKDNGIGIDKEYRESVFGLFKRLHTRKAYAGTGLGLALCRNVVGVYGGRIWVESELGKGATFFFSLPR